MDCFAWASLRQGCRSPSWLLVPLAETCGGYGSLRLAVTTTLQRASMCALTQRARAIELLNAKARTHVHSDWKHLLA